ncbi:alkaline phosphatase family protein [Cryobacterium sp. PH31-O1]|uniref:alkaline phosphatase family protein n=1 Tax=Cryobacterium sp. PH31-O1 TaxID=3046306 RepID=UPI0024B9F4D6|nr:alkaline phosphatase family protein [Cryobacterium sp. PH31-O1]MDJ0338289.1 alkaline phosphatase family protein [Cryobacterium sp. PH31-O1]
MKRVLASAALVVLLCAGVLAAHPEAAVARTPPRPAHVVIVVLENHSYSQVANEPYLTSLRAKSAVMTNAHGVTHPSQPNYLALWAGSTLGVTDSSCPNTFAAESLGSQLLKSGRSVVGYSESLPHAGYRGCRSGDYARKHNPLANFTSTRASNRNQPFSAFPSDFTRLPRVALVVPNLQNDMHDGSVARGDAWLKTNIGPYATWALTHNSLLIVTWDENDGSSGNQILTLFAGQHVVAGRYDQYVNHYSVLHTVEAAFGLPALGVAARPITNIWK